MGVVRENLIQIYMNLLKNVALWSNLLYNAKGIYSKGRKP